MDTECTVCTGVTVEEGVCRNCGAVNGAPVGRFAFIPFTDTPKPEVVLETPVEPVLETPVETPVEAPQETPVEPVLETPVEAPVEAPQEAPVEPVMDTPILDTSVENPKVDETPLAPEVSETPSEQISQESVDGAVI